MLLGSTRFAVTGGRGIQYSYDERQPYYVQSRIRGSVAQQIFGPFDVEVRGEIAYLDYRNRIGATVAVPDRTDRVNYLRRGRRLSHGVRICAFRSTSIRTTATAR